MFCGIGSSGRCDVADESDGGLSETGGGVGNDGGSDGTRRSSKSDVRSVSSANTVRGISSNMIESIAGK